MLWSPVISYVNLAYCICILQSANSRTLHIPPLALSKFHYLQTNKKGKQAIAPLVSLKIENVWYVQANMQTGRVYRFEFLEI